MAHDLLSTRLRIPPETQHIVHRPRLVDALEDAIPRHKLTLISAPAGYGKTTLLADWARSATLPVAWLSLGEEDSDIERFFRYLLAAWEGALPGVSDSHLGLLLGAMMPDRDAVLTAFINVASDLSEHVAFVLDDYHLIEDASIHDSLAFLLDNLPPTIHLVLAGRGEPPLPLARYRARMELLELDADDLQFQIEETDAFLNRQMGLHLDRDTIASLQAQLEGWVAGSQMVALTSRRQQQPDKPLVVSGRHRFIADYLSQEVLAHLPDNLRRFLMQTSILDQLSGPLCDAVTGDPDGQAMLETLERENLFIVPLDDNRAWYRYHRLFSDFLRTELGRRHPAEVAGLHQRAATWYLEHDLSEPAFDNALAGGDLHLVARVVDRFESAMLHGGELRILRDWLDAIPQDWYGAHPLFSLSRAGLFAFTGAFEECVRSIDDVDLRLSESNAPRWQLARVTAYRCYVACFANDLEQAKTFAGRALKELREEDETYRASIYHALGDTYSRNGRWREAQDSYRRVLEHPNHYAARIQSAHVFGALADLALRQGRLRDAGDAWDRALRITQEPQAWGHIPLPVIGWLYVRTAELRYERNDLAGAWQRITAGLDRAELSGDVRSMIAGYLLAGRIKLAEGDTASATTYLEHARPLVIDATLPEWTSRFDRLQLELWLTQGQLRIAVDWADTIIREETLDQRPEPEVGQLSIARVLIVEGDAPSTERAVALLDRLLRHAEVDGRMGIQIEALMLRAIGQWKLGERPEALTSLEHALRLAEPEGYLRLFADIGLPIVRLLQEARSRGVMRDYIDTILAACNTLHVSVAAGDRALPEPLTGRELEILTLVAAGLTNREIAERLSISAQTVKKHTGNIYGKLGASTRTEAVAIARAIDLLR